VDFAAVEVLHQLVPDAAFAVLFNPANPNRETVTRELEKAAQVVGVTLETLAAGNEHEIAAAFATLFQRRARALVVQGDPLFNDQSKQLAGLTLRYGIPAILPDRPFVDAGGLMSYGGSLADASRTAGLYVGRILKGEKPSDLPVQQSNKIEFVINLTTAKALGLTIPETLLATADEVIQ
jgi:putative ABC transport system substrate-binding protein